MASLFQLAMPWKCLAALSILVALATPHTPPTSAHASHVTQTESLQCGDPKRVVLAANFTIDAINVFKNDFALQEFEVPWDKVDSEIDPRNDYLFALVCDLQDHCLRVLPNITSKSHQPPQTPEDARRILVEVLGYSQRYALALETFFLDRSLYEESFLRQVDDVHRHIEDLILILMDDAGACDLSPNEHLIRNFVQMVYHGVQEELRELRDFAILRQCLLGMRYIADVFSGGIWHRSL